jgi:hypothetical protein
VITSDVRRAIARAVAGEGLGPADPGLRPTGTPGQYASSVAFASGEQPSSVAARLAARLADADGIARAEVTGPGFIAVTVTPEALAALPDRIVAAGPSCAASDALRGVRISAPPAGDPLAEATWENARAALAPQLTARLAAAAGATAALPEDTACGRRRRNGPLLNKERGTSRQPAAAGNRSGAGRRLGRGRCGPVLAGQGGAGEAGRDRSADNRAASAGQPRLCCQVRACPRRVRGALGGHLPHCATPEAGRPAAPARRSG